MDPYLYALISTFVPEHFEVLTELAGGLLIKEIRFGYTYGNGVLHSFNDEPAVNFSFGPKIWYRHGHIHRDNDLPAIVYDDGSKRWYQHGQLHRDNDLPAVIFANGGCLQWWQNDELHRDNGPAIIYDSPPGNYWYQNGIFIKYSLALGIIWGNEMI